MSPYARGMWYHQPFREPLRLTHYNFHTHVQYCVIFSYYICCIYTYKTIEGPKFHNYGRLGISFLHRQGFAKLTTKLDKFPPHSFSHLRWFDVPLMLGVWHITNLSGDLSGWQIMTSMHVHYCVTIHYHWYSIHRLMTCHADMVTLLTTRCLH